MTEASESQKPLLLTSEEIATRLRVKQTTVERWARAGRIPARKPGKSWLFDSDEFEQWLKDQAA